MIEFQHRQSAHCENGVVSNLLRFHGLEFDEPMVFGIGSGLFFGYLPFIKVNGIPATSFRIWPGQIFKNFSKRIGVEVVRKKFSTPKAAKEELDRTLDKGQPVGMLTSVFYLPYLPDAYRFHFNAHNIIVYGRQNGTYMVSDPVMNTVTEISSEDLSRARFAKGMPEPSGRMYYPKNVNGNYNVERAVWKGIRHTSDWMTHIPVPLFGVKGMRMLSKKLKQWPEQLGNKKAILYLGNLIRMQEEIGTGGAGFRFIYAAFLDQISARFNDPKLFELSRQLTEGGDQLREFAYYAGRVCKDRKSDTKTFAELAVYMEKAADIEQKVFTDLYKLGKGK